MILIFLITLRDLIKIDLKLCFVSLLHNLAVIFRHARGLKFA